MDSPTDGQTDFQTRSYIDLPHYNTMVKETHEIGYFCRRSSTGSISQSECLDFGYGPITEAICLATSGEIENLPLKVMNHNLNRILTNVTTAPAFFFTFYELLLLFLSSKTLP